MFQRTREGGFSAEHHPFTQPTCTPDELKADPEVAKAAAYDVVVNGYELGGGSLRIHEEMQSAGIRRIAMASDAQPSSDSCLMLCNTVARHTVELPWGWIDWRC